MATIKVSSPKIKEMIDESQMLAVINQFKSKLSDAPNGLEEYALTINIHASDAMCNEIAKLYSKAGWVDVICVSSESQGGAKGTTSLKLKTK